MEGEIAYEDVMLTLAKKLNLISKLPRKVREAS